MTTDKAFSVRYIQRYDSIGTLVHDILCLGMERSASHGHLYGEHSRNFS